MRFRSVRRRISQAWNAPIALALIFSFLTASPMAAQQLTADAVTPPDALIGAAQDAASAPKALHIVILEGEGALNNIRQRTAREPIVQVQDENHKPVAGALVLFTIHGGASGAGGTFADGATSLTVTTGADGRAIAHGLQINQVPGTYTITVEATFGTLEAVATIQQTDTSSSQEQSQATQPAAKNGTSFLKKFVSKPTLLVAAAAGVAVVVVVLSTRSKGTTITAGTGTVGPAIRSGLAALHPR